MNINSKFPYHFQYDRMDCGPACIRMICNYYGRDFDLDYLRQISFIGKQGVSLLDMSEACERIGLKSMMVQITIDQLIEDCPLPAILHWNQNHFVVLHKIKKTNSIFSRKKDYEFSIADPAHDLITVDRESFIKSWQTNNTEKGIALMLVPTEDFYKDEEDIEDKTKEENKGLLFLLKYIKPYKKYFVQLFIGMLLGSGISLLFPYLMQNLVDNGVANKNLNIVLLILMSQLVLFIGETAVELIRNWILLHVNTRISLAIISDFLVKLMKLPVKFYDSRTTGDITQRINDHYRIENFLTSTALISFFSIINIIVFSVVLTLYNWKIFAVFFSLSVLSCIWVVLFLKKRKNLDYKRFQSLRDNQDSIMEIVAGMQEIKLNNSELSKRWDWERIQAKLFKINTKSLLLDQYQRIGFNFITQLKNIIISYIATVEVINGNISIGMMLSISYIIGQTNEPLRQLINFFRSLQDAKISTERLREIHAKESEEEFQMGDLKFNAINTDIHDDIILNDVSFKYGGPHSPSVLKNIDLVIPKGKITAIVGTSGSGKTTLLKLLLKFYQPLEGNIKIGLNDINSIDSKYWRKQCGTVMQDGYIFANTIARNIAVDGNEIDKDQLYKSIEVANITEYIKGLPAGLGTLLGANGNGLSGGQIQRLLISRAVYKNPNYLFFDEATSSLDANNEKIIMENLDSFFNGKTVVTIAHRLSTVKNADQIIVLDKGEIIERGDHKTLVAQKGAYYNLVKNQLELEK